MASKSFDKVFLHLPPFDRENDFINFWDNAFSELKQVPISPELKSDKSKTSFRFKCYSVSFKGFNRATVTGDLFFPKTSKKITPVIIINDYNKRESYPIKEIKSELAYFFLNIRGHDLLPEYKDTEEHQLPGYMVDNILDKNSYFLKGIYLDAFRAIDVLRLSRKFDCSSIGIIGKGLGAAAAIFAAAYSARIKALVLDTPSFCYLPLNQNLSESDATAEINNYISLQKNKRKLIKKNLTYFDSINFSDKIQCPVLTIVGLKDSISPPECVFALFNHILSDKTIEVYPDDGNSVGGIEQVKKSFKWIEKKLFENP